MAFCATLAALAGSTASAQCSGTWIPVEGLLGAGGPGTNGTVNASAAWDPDGPGPLPTHLVIGGDFTLVGSTVASSIAMYNPASGQWSALAKGLDGTVLTLAVDPSGNLVAGGRFSAAGNSTAGDVPASLVARWNRTSARWEAMGAGLTAPGGEVSALATYGGQLYAGGTFTSSGASAVSGVVRWNSSTGTWAPLGTGLTSQYGVPRVNSLLADATGLYVGGSFSTAGGLSRTNLARWDGSSWSGSVGTCPFTQEVMSLASYNGTVAAAGYIGFVFSVRALTPSTGSWATLGANLSNLLYSASLGVHNNELYLGGWYSNGQSTFMVGKLVAGAWTPVNSSGAVSANTFTSLGQVLYVGGSFGDLGSVKCRGVASLDTAQTWRALASGGNRRVNALTALPNGDVIVGGEFTTAGGVTVNNIARYTPSTGAWSALGVGTDGPVNALLTMPNGDIIAGGAFGYVGGEFYGAIARYNPATGWRPVTGSLGFTTTGFFTRGAVNALALRHDGRLVIGGQFSRAGEVTTSNVVTWDPVTNTFSGMGAGTIDGPVTAVTVLPAGDIIVGGYFSCLGGALQPNGTVNCTSGVRAYRVARWTGSAWAPYASAANGDFPLNPLTLTTTPAGDVVAGGDATTGIARVLTRTASGWAADATTSLPLSVSVLGRGASDGYTAGGLGGSTYQRMVARKVGTATADFGPDTRGSVSAMATLPNGDCVIGGTFATVGNARSVYLAIWRDGGKPSFTTNPSPGIACAGGAAAYAAAAVGAGPVAYQWQVRAGADGAGWYNLGPAPLTLPCGATASATNATGATTAITISPCAGAPAPRTLAYKVRCVVSQGGCAQTPGPETTHTLCRANHDCQNSVDLLDIFAFLEDWFAGNARANFNDLGTVDLLDIFDFLQAWFDGCGPG